MAHSAVVDTICERITQLYNHPGGCQNDPENMGLFKHSNQHKPCRMSAPALTAQENKSPLEELGPSILKYYEMGMADTDILKHLLDRHVDKEKYGLSIKSLKKMRGQLGLQSIWQQNHDLDSALHALQHVRARYPKAGMRDMKLHILREEGVKVSCVQSIARKLHTGVEPYSGKILWLQVWWTNKNPGLILHYYLEAVQELGAMPLVTQSDPGSENYGVANGHTTLWHMFDPLLQGTRQHRWMQKHNNVKPEILWSQLQRRFTPGFEDLLDDGVHAGWYDPNDPLDVLLFRWLFIPWLQVELDTLKDSHNTAPKRADKNKILPHGRPQLIFEAPHMYDSLDFKVGITPEAVQQVHEHYAPSDDPMFILVPPAFGQLAERIYHSVSRPSISRETIWGIFGNMLVKIRDIYVNEPTAALEAAACATVTDEGPEAQPVIPLTM
ncbi:hypothetical protein K439DRAFT_1618322 [Ramaria rubella]|nr:hypothetical protein K439DRAFT_1618322 [Ramaria rubella]